MPSCIRPVQPRQKVAESIEKIDRPSTSVFIDSSVENYQHLIQGIEPEAEVFVLDSAEDGIAQITRTLQERSEIKTVHLVCHGAPGCLYLGGTQLSLDTLDSYASELKIWFTSDQPRKSLLLYGCQVGAGERGAQFLNRLHSLTGATIAASANLKGNSRFGGDWNLEVKTGEIDVSLAFSPAVRESYTGVLATFTVNTLADENDGLDDGQISLREALEAANNALGADIIQFDASLSGGTIVLTGGELSIRDALTIDGLGADNLTVSGNNNSRVFSIGRDDIVEIEGLTIADGNSTEGAGIYNQGDLTLKDSVISGNTASGGGGGIFNWGYYAFVRDNPYSYGRLVTDNSKLTVTNSTIADNTASTGGGIFNQYGDVTINDSIISNNTAGSGRGGGIHSVAFTREVGFRRFYDLIALGTLAVNGTTISNNTASTNGGGIFNASSDLSMSNSTISGNTAGVDGGGIASSSFGTNYVGYKSGDIAISNSTISDNMAGGKGGGISSNLDQQTGLNIYNSNISGNEAGSDGGGIFGTASGNNQWSTLSISNSTISDNRAGSDGGGLFTTAGSNNLTVGISDSTVSDNVAAADGGGIFNDSSSTTIEYSFLSTLVLSDSTISGNTASSDGGGLYTKSSPAVYPKAAVLNSTISGNVADEKGGGIFNNAQILTLIQSTIAANTASANGGGGVFNNNEASVGNTIIAGNTDNTGNNDIGGNAFDSQGYNLIGNGDGASGFGVTGDLVGTGTNPIDPLLGPLQDNGGSTETHALQPGSPAIDAGNNDFLNQSLPIANFTITTDQRGEPRIQNRTVDIGSYEYDAVRLIALTPLALEGGGSGIYRLSYDRRTDSPIEIQLTAIGGDGLTPDEFTLSGVSGTFPNFTVTIPQGEIFVDLILTASADAVVEGNETLTLKLVPSEAYEFNNSFSEATVTILEQSTALLVTNTNDSGAGSLRQAILNANAIAGANTITFDASLAGQTIGLTSQTLEITDDLFIDGLGADKLTISGNNSFTVFNISNYTKTIEVEIEGLKITEGNISSFRGGGIFNIETLTVTDSIISGNRSYGGGGGIYNRGNLVISNSTISGNTTVREGGGGIKNNGGTVQVTNSTISGNTAARYGGGGIENNAGTVIVANSTISGNTAARYGDGGGISNGGNLTIIGSTISGNTANSGGGIENSGELTVFNSTINGNTANSSIGGGGGGIANSGDLTLTNSTISGNTAAADGGGIDNRYGKLTTIDNSTITLNQAQPGRGSGIISISSRTIQVGNSIISGNLNSDIDVPVDDTFTSRGHNIIGTGNAVDDFNSEGDITGITDPQLGPLQNNGGPTETHALLPGSPAIDAGSNTLIPADTLDSDGDGNTSEPLPFDQRGEGFPRIVDGIVDIGAYEASVASAPIVTAIATVGNPSEANTLPGTFIISRGTDTRGDLVVNLNLGGTASPGSDYTVNFTDGTVTIPDGQNRIDITIAPIDDPIVDRNETIILTITPDDAYQIGNPDTASLTIVDDDLDVIKGTPRSDTLTGTVYNDLIDGRGGDDLLKGLAGNDTYIVDSILDVVVELPAQGIDTVKSSANYTLTANVENLILTGKSNLNGTGNNLNNLIQGNRGNNILEGLAGKDTLSGAAGDDTLSGGAGDDLLEGGRGNDRFLFASGAVFSSSAFGVDILSDFAKKTDKIALSKTSFAALTSAIDSNLQASELATINSDESDEASLASSSSAKIVYNLGTGNLLYNQNGVMDGLGDGGLFATLTGIPQLNRNNFAVQT